MTVEQASRVYEFFLRVEFCTAGRAAETVASFSVKVLCIVTLSGALFIFQNAAEC